jgi:phosphoglycerate dehydrogenase-like enzyme
VPVRFNPSALTSGRPLQMVVAHCLALLHVKDLSSTYILVASIPLTDETTGIIDAAALDELGPEGLLVNVARGPVVDEKALYEALKDRRIAGAAVDVWYQYPASDGRRNPPPFPSAGSTTSS